MLDLEFVVLLVVRRGGVFKKARTDDPTPPTRRGEATNDQDDRRSRALGLMSVPNLKESVSSPVPQIYTRFYIFARVPRDESRRVSSKKLSFQLSFKAATELKCADLRTRCPTARFKARAARPPPNCGGHGTSYKSYFDFDLHPCNVWGCHGSFQGRALP